jgi:hypothetical protein
LAQDTSDISLNSVTVLSLCADFFEDDFAAFSGGGCSLFSTKKNDNLT